MRTPVPRNFRPARHGVALLAVATLVLAGCLSPEGERTLELVNGERAARGVAALTNDGDLNDAARTWAEHLAARRILDHSGLSSRVPANWSRVSENVGRGPSPDSIHSAWMRSPQHLANLVDPRVNRTGIGTAYDASGRLYVVQIFAG